MGKRILILATLSAALVAKDKTPRSPIDDYISQSLGANPSGGGASAGSAYVANGLLANAARDLRASQVDDLVTVVVADRASAVTKGSTGSTRQSSANYGVGAILGPVKAGSRLTDLVRLSGSRDLKGEGETTRENALTTTLSARVTHVLPNGNMVVEGAKEVRVNGENQNVRVRGILRPYDISPGNMVRSDRLAHLEVRIDGRGVINDAVKRPNVLYRMLLGIMPF